MLHVNTHIAKKYWSALFSEQYDYINENCTFDVLTSQRAPVKYPGNGTWSIALSWILAKTLHAC